jgi:hypothetical protein
LPANLDVASFAFIIYETKISPCPLRRDATATTDVDTKTFQPNRATTAGICFAASSIMASHA